MAREYHLHLISDSTGETLNTVAKAVCAQFDGVMVREHIYSLVRNRVQLRRAVEHITANPGIVFFTCGKREPELAREVNDRDFDVALHVVFTDRAAHDAYQNDPTHNQFIAEMKQNWAKVRVFDSLVERV